MVVILNVSSKRDLEISGVSPSRGSAVWSHPFSASLITPGVAFTPVSIGDTVLVLAPASGPSNPTIRVQGVNAATGRTLWTLSQSLVLSDAPVVCATGRYFCLPTYVSSTTTALIALDPSTGAVVGSVQGPLRNMAVAPPGTLNSSDLWQTDNLSAPTFMQTSATGQQVWTQSVANLFGGNQFNPDYGWDFLVTADLDIGSVGVTLVGKSEPLGGLKTVGISTSTGSVEWSVAGSLFCGGGLQFLTTDLICHYEGTAHSNGKVETMPGVKLTLTGINPTSGATTWTLSAKDPQALSLGTNVAFQDGSHLVVQSLSGKWEVLDVTDGKVALPSAKEVFWCEKVLTYKVVTPKGVSAHGERTGGPVYQSCSANGASIGGLPRSTPSTVGVTSDGLYIWPTPTGLQATRPAGSA
jgi:hypothetical protein